MMKLSPKIQIFIFLGLFLFSIIVMNRFIRSALKMSLSDVSKTDESQNQNQTAEVFVEKNSKYHLVADDPDKYNIKSQGEQDIPLTQAQWEYRMRQGLKQSRADNANPALSLAGIEKTPEEIEGRINELNAQIKAYEAAALNNPGDRNAQEKLQTLYMLKATLTVLKDKVTKPH